MGERWGVGTGGRSVNWRDGERDVVLMVSVGEEGARERGESD